MSLSTGLAQAERNMAMATDFTAAEPLRPARTADDLRQEGLGNLLLRRLDEADFLRLAPFMERVPLELDAILARAGEEIETVCFPEGAVAAFLDVLKDGRRLTVGLVGREGFVGWPMLMGDDRWPYEVTIRAEASTALRLEARHLRTAVERSPALQNLLLRYTSTFMAQMGRTIVSNLIHSVERRTARWILLYQDRVSGDQIALTHEELGIMLGVRRASITHALHYLEGEGAIASLRGRVVVRDRARLEALAEETYGYSEAEYQRLFRR